MFLSLLFGARSCRQGSNTYQQGGIASDGVPTLSDLVHVTDRHQSEYHSLQLNYNTGTDVVTSQLQCLKVVIQLNSKNNKEGERFKFLKGDEINGCVTISNSTKDKLP